MLFWRKIFVQRYLVRNGSPRTEGGSSCGVSVWFEVALELEEVSHPGPTTGPTRWDTSSDGGAFNRLFEVRLPSGRCQSPTAIRTRGRCGHDRGRHRFQRQWPTVEESRKRFLVIMLSNFEKGSLFGQ